ncbi:MAG: RcpC/CpaB family pilus assembly protein [Erysipelotrichaceae bacterium]
MKNKKNNAILAVLLLLIVNVLVFNIVMKKSIDYVEMPYAIKNIPPRSKITSNMIGTIKIAHSATGRNTIDDKKSILGKYTDINGMIPSGSLIYKSMIYKKESLPDYPTLLLKNGQTAFSLPSDLVKLSGNTITSGQKVDLYVTVPQRNENPIIDRFVKGVRVLSIKDRNGYEISDEKSTKIPYVVILGINDSIIPYLKTAAKIGSIDLYAPANNYQKDEESILIEDSKVLPYLNHE